MDCAGLSDDNMSLDLACDGRENGVPRPQLQRARLRKSPAVCSEIRHHVCTETILAVSYTQPVTGYGKYMRQLSFWET